MKEYRQQGDVLVIPASIPANATRVRAKGGRLILAEGEVTGHCHAVQAGDGVSLMEADGKLYLSTVKEIPLTHEEHGTITIPAGDYMIGIVQEYDYFEEEARKVRD